MAKRNRPRCRNKLAAHFLGFGVRHRCGSPAVEPLRIDNFEANRTQTSLGRSRPLSSGPRENSGARKRSRSRSGIHRPKSPGCNPQSTTSGNWRFGTRANSSRRPRKALTSPAGREPPETDLDDHFNWTCGRSISESEAADVIATLDQQIASWQGIAAQRRDDGQNVRVRVSELEVEITTSQQRANTLIELRTRIGNGEEKTAEKEAEVARLTSDLDALQGDAIAPATDAEIADLRERLNALSAISVAAQGIAQRYAQLQELAKREVGERATLAELGESAYDAAKHRAAGDSLDEANRAAAAIQTIDRDLGRRDDIVTRREASVGEIVTIARDLDRVGKDRAALAYQDDESKSARERATAAADADRQATSLLHMAQTAERERTSDVGRLQEEQRRWQQQLDRSAALRREADELSEMYKEFALFDQFVAARVAPRLAEQTSELLEIATDGKYTSVEFDENYGIHVFDGVTEKFPIESFSGGERDVVALCARLALSQLIGSSAAHPPSFLVLDEVFGALDRDRRMQLLELLGRISESIEAFQQMFIISHVDDVRTSPIFSRVIRIVETPNGSSRIEDATASASFEE
ncbi:MAG: SbcC/MukB-like Walker B domain-containing protein [Thermomicrobiales bacterium]